MKQHGQPRTITYLLHVLFWVGYGATLYASLSNWNNSPGEVWKAVISDVVSSCLIAYLNLLVLLPRLYGKGKYGLYVLISLSLVVTLIYLRVTVFHVALAHKNLGYTYFIRSIPAFGFYMLSTVIWFVSTSISSQRREVELRNSQLDSELKFLKLQLSPHFLFNTLNNIYSMAYFNDVNTAPAILKLSGMMRHMIYQDKGEFIPLSKEIAFMENVVELWRLKLDEKPVIVFKHFGVNENHRIAHLIFLAFLENAFKHGNTINGSILVHLTVSEENVVHFHVKNDIMNFPNTNKEQSGVGLSNVRKRLELLYPGKHQLQLRNGPSHFEVNLTIDLK